MKKSLVRIFILIIAFGILLCGCTGTGRRATEEPVVLDQGSTTSPEFSNTESESHDPSLAPIFPGAQKLNSSGEINETRESYITRAPYDAVEQYYADFLKYGVTEPPEKPETEYTVNTIASRDENGRRQTAIWVNREEGPNSGLKVMIKEYETQNAVQIILTNLDETPIGFNPVGMYLTPEELDAWLDEYNTQQAEHEAEREETEGQAVEPPVLDDSQDESGAEDESAVSDNNEGDE
jgi:hypothetical protein